jgi:hypothetical protein
VAVSIGAALAGLVGVRAMLPAPPTHFPTAGVERSIIDDAGSEVQVMPSPSPSGPALDPGGQTDVVEYAVSLHELRGLPPDAGLGTVLDLWVAWDAAYAEGPQIQRLVRSVTLSRLIEPVTPEGPVVAVLSVPERSVGKLMYGDLYGSLSATLPTS